jgi:nickel/cobalt transporter (NicO) family protein
VSTTPAVLAAAAGVALGHAVLPDHWVPLAVMGRTRRYPIRRVARLSILAGIAHVALSLLLGAGIIAVGLQLRSLVEGAQNLIVGGVLVATGVGFLVVELTGRGHHHDHDDDDDHDHDHEFELGGSPRPAPGGDQAHRAPGLAAVMVPFGAAASPDLTILPVFLAATTVGVATSIAALVVFSGVTIVTIVTLTLGATFGGYQIRGGWLERWGNRVTALTLVVIGGLVATGVI